MGAVYCAFAVSFFNFYQANFYEDMLSYKYALVHYEKAVSIECSAIYIITEPKVN